MPQKRDPQTGKFVANGGAYVDERGYPRISCGPCRGQRIHRVKASVMEGRELRPTEDVHHRDGKRDRFSDSNLEVMSHGAHSSLTAWERMKQRKEDEFLKAQWNGYFEDKSRSELNVGGAMSENVWHEEFASLEGSASTDAAFLDVWNRNVIPWMEKRGIEYKRVAHAYATKRGFVFDKEKHAYVSPWKMEATRGKNLIGVGWRDSVLRCAFAAKTGARFYHSTSIPVPMEVKIKLLRSPYPDKLYTQIVKGKYPMEREL